MPDRQVTRTSKDRDGDILRLCRPGEHWSPRAKADAVRDIELRNHQYFVLNRVGRKTYIHVYESGGRKHLRTDPNDHLCDNLDELPEC
ncbi:MAG: DUF3892 domain-containing protein [Abyssibacter sp.]|uniref:DUF3892 domain-containing protein n=1 Tax=Abyssibacter sp. TaxID=2320200 RepID=UPI003219A423